jgi:hypothetical protein
MWMRRFRWWPMKRQTVLLLTAYDQSFADLASLTLPRMRAYAERNKCEFRAITEIDSSRPGGWLKIPPIRQALSEGFDFILWIDADALLIRNDVDIRDEVRPNHDLSLSWLGPETTDWQAPPDVVGHFNTGVMLIRNTPWAHDFFARVWASTPMDHSWWEQATILHLLGYNNLIGKGIEDPTNVDRQRVHKLDPAWNSVPGIAMAADPIVHHYAGVDMSKRFDLMRTDGMMPVSVKREGRLERARRVSAAVRQARER